MRGCLIEQLQERLDIAFGAVQQVEQAVRSFDPWISLALLVGTCDGCGCLRARLLGGFFCSSLRSDLGRALPLQALGFVTCSSCGPLLLFGTGELGVTLFLGRFAIAEPE